MFVAPPMATIATPSLAKSCPVCVRERLQRGPIAEPFHEHDRPHVVGDRVHRRQHPMRRSRCRAAL